MVTPVAVAIDGPAGSGKSTVSRLVAQKLGFATIDTGAMYRTVTLAALQHNLQVDKTLSQHTFKFVRGQNLFECFVDGANVTDEIRAPKVAAAVSTVAADRAVRAWAVSQQQNMVHELLQAGVGVVLEGRDIGTTVVPNSPAKFFLTASLAARTQRRALESGEATAAVEANLVSRDTQDSQREISPLIQADDAELIDTSDLRVEEVVELIVKKVNSL